MDTQELFSTMNFKCARKIALQQCRQPDGRPALEPDDGTEEVTLVVKTL